MNTISNFFQRKRTPRLRSAVPLDYGKVYPSTTLLCHNKKRDPWMDSFLWFFVAPTRIELVFHA